MTQRTWFSLALRILGAMQLVEALKMLVQAYDIQTKALIPQAATVAGSLHYAFAEALIALALLLGAPFLSGLLVGRDPPGP